MSSICPRLWIPPLLLYTTDVTVTLLHQPRAYWAGDYATVREGNPLFRALLAWHPSVFLAVVLAWAIAFVLILRWWRHPLTKPMALILTLGHAIGAGSWLVGHGWLGWVAAIGLLITAERLLTWSWRPSHTHAERSTDDTANS